MDPAYAEHPRVKDLLLNLSPEKAVAVNPTVIHESYHTLVYGQKFTRAEASNRLGLLLKHPYIHFLNQTRRTCLIGLDIATRYKLGGRDALILANYISGKILVMYTHDRELLSLQRVAWRSASLEIRDPLAA
ncbi:MAG: PIN domain-containing protein [Candidatus Bathyarchaeota archaeon]|nr:PIN domain-containing protein [Candidatus Bathyarchaeota archaeon]